MPLVKYDSIGNIQWAIVAEHCYPSGLAADLFGNLYALCSYSDSVVTIGGKTITNPHAHKPPYYIGSSYYMDSFSYFIIKINASGSVVWLKNIGDINCTGGGSNTSGNCLAVDSCGNIIAGVSFVSRLNIGSQLFITKDTGAIPVGDMFVAKFDSAGNYLWGRQYGGKKIDYLGGVVATGGDDIFIGGTFKSDTLQLGSTILRANRGDLVQFSSFVSKLNEAGDVVWAREFTLDDSVLTSVHGINVDREGDLFVTGQYTFRGSFPPITVPINSISLPVRSYKIFGFLFKFSNIGTPLWGKSIRSEGEFSYGPAIDGCGNAWIHSAHDMPTTNAVVSDTVDAHIITAPLINNDPVFVIGFNGSGSYLTSACLLSGAGRQPGIAADASGNIYVTTHASMDTFIVAGDSIYNSSLAGITYNMYVAKFNPALGCYTEAVNSNKCGEGVVMLPIINANPGLSIFPNPASNTITIETSDPIESICIISVHGQHLLYKKGDQLSLKDVLDVSALAPGMYIVRLNNSTFSKFIKQ